MLEVVPCADTMIRYLWLDMHVERDKRKGADPDEEGQERKRDSIPAIGCHKVA